MEYPVPVVRLIITNAENKTLVLKRQNTSYGDGQWCLPGGKIDYNDTVDRTVQKELEEETALTCEKSRFLFYQDSLPLEEGKMHCINLYFECDVTGEIRLNEESSDYAWIGPEDLDAYRLAFRHDLGLKRYWNEIKLSE